MLNPFFRQVTIKWYRSIKHPCKQSILQSLNFIHKFNKVKAKNELFYERTVYERLSCTFYATYTII